MCPVPPQGVLKGLKTSFAAAILRSSPSQWTLTPDLYGTPQGGDDQSITSPSTDSLACDCLVARNPTPFPIPPKRRHRLLSGFLKSKDNYSASAPSTPTYAAVSQLSLPLKHPESPSKPHRGESLITRKLFGHKGKESSIDPDELFESWDIPSDVEWWDPTSMFLEPFLSSPGPTSARHAPTPTNGADSNQHHYPGHPLPHPPGASQSSPVRPVLFDLFFEDNISVPAG
jgi:hypothetical protein